MQAGLDERRAAILDPELSRVFPVCYFMVLYVFFSYLWTCTTLKNFHSKLRDSNFLPPFQ